MAEKQNCARCGNFENLGGFIEINKWLCWKCESLPQYLNSVHTKFERVEFQMEFGSTDAWWYFVERKTKKVRQPNESDLDGKLNVEYTVGKQKADGTVEVFDGKFFTFDYGRCEVKDIDGHFDEHKYYGMLFDSPQGH